MSQSKLYEPYVVVSDPITEANTGATVQAVDVPAGALVTEVVFLVTEAFAGGTPSVDVGDGDDADGWVDTLDITEGTIGSYRGGATNSPLSVTGKYYPDADTIDAVVSAGLTDGTGYVVARMIRLDEVV